MKKPLFPCLVVLAAWPALNADAATTCTFAVTPTTWTLQGNCTTDATIVVTAENLDGGGFTIAAVDPAAGHFRGAILLNGGPVLNVDNVIVTAAGLADVCDGGADRLRGIMLEGASGSVTNSRIVDINQGASGCQEGNGIEVRNFGASPERVRVTIDSNVVTGYQKGGIIVNGDADGTVTNNRVDGLGPVGYIARNGIQFGFGGSGMAKRNYVAGNSYTGSSTISVGILGIGGPAYAADYFTGLQVMQNEIVGNDVGVYLDNSDVGLTAPATATNNKVTNNVISHNAVTNGYVYQAAVADIGNNDKITANRISGLGYDPATVPGSTFAVDAAPAFTNRAKVHANK